MISGALMLNKNDSIKKIYQKNILRMITAFCFWSFLYALKDKYVLGLNLRSTVITFFQGYVHMWFMFMIVGIYMIIPFLRKIVKDEQTLRYFVILGFVFCILIPQLLSVIGIINQDWKSFFSDIIDKVEMRFCIGFPYYFVMGYYISKHRFKKKTRVLLYLLALIGALGIVFGNLALSYFKGDRDSTFSNEFSLFVFMSSIGIFELFKNISSKFEKSEKVRRASGMISDLAFGTYLAHILVIWLSDELLGFNVGVFNPVLSIPVLSLFVFAVSCVITVC